MSLHEERFCVITPEDLGRPLVFGHRGASVNAVDNSIAAFEQAVADGADGVELDVRFTADRKVVLHHDADVGEMGPLVHHDFETIRQTHPEIPTLGEGLAALADLLINVEIKNWPTDADFDHRHEMATVIARWVACHDLYDRVLVTSFNPATVAAVRTADASITTGQLMPTGFAITPKSTAQLAAVGNLWLAANVVDIVPDPPAAVEACHGAGIQLLAWTVDDAAATTALTQAGIDVIVSNDPAATLATIAEI